MMTWVREIPGAPRTITCREITAVANPYKVAELGYMGEVFYPVTLRQTLHCALEMLKDKRDELRRRSIRTFLFGSLPMRRPSRCGYMVSRTSLLAPKPRVVRRADPHLT